MVTIRSVGTSTLISAVSVLDQQQQCRAAKWTVETDGLSTLPELLKCMVHLTLSFLGWPCNTGPPAGPTANQASTQVHSPVPGVPGATPRFFPHYLPTVLALSSLPQVCDFYVDESPSVTFCHPFPFCSSHTLFPLVFGTI